MSIRRSLGGLAVLILVGAVAGSAASPSRAAFPQLWTWPGCAADQGRPPANDTLQDCIDGASPGDGIGITTNQPVAEFPTISKSLTLFGSPGFYPSLQGVAVATANATPIQASIRHLTMTRSLVGHFNMGSGHVLIVDDVTVTGSIFSDPALELQASVPATIVASHSRFDIGGTAETDGIFLLAYQATGLVTFSMIGDRISGQANANGASGIDLQLRGSGTTRVNLMNDSIWDVAGCGCGGSAGIFVSAQDTVTAKVNIVGASIHHSRGDGLDVRSALTGGRLSLNVFNSVFSLAKYRAITLTSSSLALLKLRAGHNDFYRNGFPNWLEGRLTGSGNLAVNPRYVNGGAGDLRLRRGSPLIDKGMNCPPGGIANPDAAGHNRLAGASVDIGAYEFGAGPPRPLPACH